MFNNIIVTNYLLNLIHIIFNLMKCDNRDALYILHLEKMSAHKIIIC